MSVFLNTNHIAIYSMYFKYLFGIRIFFSITFTIHVAILLAVPLTLRTITLYKWTDENGQPKSLRILDEISSRWTEVGDLLGLSPASLEAIEVDRLRMSRSCCRDVLHDWIQNNQGSYPVSWEGLICLLTDMKLTILAKELENALRARDIL